jgi:hypothetical protein
MFGFYAVIKDSFLKHLWTIREACDIYSYTSHEYADYVTSSVKHICKCKMYNQKLDFIISVILRCKQLRTVIGFYKTVPFCLTGILNQIEQFSSNCNFESTGVVYISVNFCKRLELFFCYNERTKLILMELGILIKIGSQKVVKFRFVVVASVFISKSNVNTAYYERWNADIFQCERTLLNNKPSCS